TLCEITREIRDVIFETIDSTDDYGELVAVRPRDITRKIDLKAEEALDVALENRGISARVISEELGDRTLGGEPEFLLVFDPVDGSTNATCGIPFFCTSLALCEKTTGATFNDVTMAAVTCIDGTTYSAVKNRGAFVNGKPIAEGKKGRRTKPVLTIYSYGAKTIPSGLIELEKHVIQRVLGSIALEMCYVADNRLDGIVEVRGLISSYDIMASQLILKEAGGRISDLKGGEIIRDAKATGMCFIATKNEQLHTRILGYLR
ncbi:MAG: inositol monophosphatase family protein, partial [Mariprofundales bacterium]|nr:inositol monophosphatase family protein [Mariprofundales bacterium]